MERLLKQIKNITAFQDLKAQGADIYLVGGCVRDYFLGKESKDIDVIVRLLDDHTIINTLNKYGRVDRVGESFGVIKFTPKGWTGEPIDIAQPRRDVLIDKTKGHHGIKAAFDPDISIELDLKRRDFTINSIAISWDGNIIDPFNGLKDINRRIIRATSKDAFIEDPLRLLRAIQFAARFGFAIEDYTWQMICEWSLDIKTISAERILVELDKIFFKGDRKYGLSLLYESGLHSAVFDQPNLKLSANTEITTIGDFYYVMCGSADTYRKVLKGEIFVEKQIKSIELLWTPSDEDKRKVYYDSIQISDWVLKANVIPHEFLKTQRSFIYRKYPRTIKDLDINGNDLLALGYTGPAIGKILKEMILSVLTDKVENEKEALLTYYLASKI
jgi:tRNA nucleotidyltransferase/poly(A) polymerase